MFNSTDYNIKTEIMYPIELTKPMSQDLTEFGFEALENEQQVVDKLTDQTGTTLVVVNSVCGCAAGMARPGVKMSINSDKKPNNLYTVFAGFDKEATSKVREFLLPYPPSSPSIALFKDGKLVHMVERHHIEGNSAEKISEHLQKVYGHFC